MENISTMSNMTTIRQVVPNGISLTITSTDLNKFLDHAYMNAVMHHGPHFESDIHATDAPVSELALKSQYKLTECSVNLTRQLPTIRIKLARFNGGYRVTENFYGNLA